MPGTLSTSEYKEGTTVMPIAHIRKLRLREETLVFGSGSFNSKVKCRSA